MAEIADSDSPDPLSSTPPRLATYSPVSPASPSSDFDYNYPSESPPNHYTQLHNSAAAPEPLRLQSRESDEEEELNRIEHELLGFDSDDDNFGLADSEEESLFVNDRDDHRYDNDNDGDFDVNLHPIGQQDTPRSPSHQANLYGNFEQDRDFFINEALPPPLQNHRWVPLEMDVQQPNNPRGQHQPRAQPEVIDLTGDNDGPTQLAPQHHSQNARRQRSQQQNPPRLSRSDASYVGSRTVIDLISDSDDDPAVIALPPAPRRNNPPRRVNQAPLFERQPPQQPPQPPQPPPQQAQEERDLGARRYFQQLMREIPLFRLVHNGPNMDYRDEDDIVIMGHRNLMPDAPPAPAGPLPNVNLDYLAHPFPNQARAPGGLGGKPAHEPPKETREGFTRNTGEEVIAICPSCELELAYDPDEDDKGQAPPAKKARTKKDKAEHHFWAVKACGHVRYCTRDSPSFIGINSFLGLLQDVLREPQARGQESPSRGISTRS